jgi:hypothetical protein
VLEGADALAGYGAKLTVDLTVEEPHRSEHLLDPSVLLG